MLFLLWFMENFSLYVYIQLNDISFSRKLILVWWQIVEAQ